MSNAQTRAPVFLHALFRSGSTYLYRAFRRLDGVTCFQEPMHEIAVEARDNPQLLQEAGDPSKAGELRHAALGAPYFAELHAIADQCLPYLRESDVYDGYFGDRTHCAGLDYWQALVRNAPERPVIQECRSSGRIAALRHNLGGYHAYLWRNPWDQWWSYQVSPYFDLTTQLVLNAASRPAFLDQLADHIGFKRLEGRRLHVTYDWFAHRPLPPGHAYQAFYALWLLALHQARSHADLLINIDTLSASAAERQRIAQALASEGAQGLDFSDCHSPVTVFTHAEKARFQALEHEVHELWRQSGMPEQALEAIQALRKHHEPVRDDELARSGELARYRELVDRRRREMAGHLHSSDAALQAAHRREDSLRERIELLEQENEAGREHLAEAVTDYETTLNRLYNSYSWRVTAPLRYAIRGVNHLRAHGAKSLLARGIASAEHRSRHYPRLRRALVALVSRVPGVARRLRRLQLGGNPEHSASTELLTPRARTLYSELKGHIEDSPGRGHHETRD
ncbi:hypothetical protein [Vreelandella utahensis]|uniref:hypothetical protein n=1 Tax=Vreelandella halophila TaxID=86177 RepID=UPI000986035D|nr:hypothetical protein [Halomonas utahensis]